MVDFVCGSLRTSQIFRYFWDGIMTSRASTPDVCFPYDSRVSWAPLLPLLHSQFREKAAKGKFLL